MPVEPPRHRAFLTMSMDVLPQHSQLNVFRESAIIKYLFSI